MEKYEGAVIGFGRQFKNFTKAVHRRLQAGAAEYSDKNFSADPLHLIDELQQECMDLAGWGFILHQRLERMREAVGKQRPLGDPEIGEAIRRNAIPTDPPRRAKIQWSARSDMFLLIKENDGGIGHNTILMMSSQENKLLDWADAHGWEVVG